MYSVYTEQETKVNREEKKGERRKGIEKNGFWRSVCLWGSDGSGCVWGKGVKEWFSGYCAMHCKCKCKAANEVVVCCMQCNATEQKCVVC